MEKQTEFYVLKISEFIRQIGVLQEEKIELTIENVHLDQTIKKIFDKKKEIFVWHKYIF